MLGHASMVIASLARMSNPYLQGVPAGGYTGQVLYAQPSVYRAPAGGNAAPLCPGPFWCHTGCSLISAVLIFFTILAASGFDGRYWFVSIVIGLILFLPLGYDIKLMLVGHKMPLNQLWTTSWRSTVSLLSLGVVSLSLALIANNYAFAFNNGRRYNLYNFEIMIWLLMFSFAIKYCICCTASYPKAAISMQSWRLGSVGANPYEPGAVPSPAQVAVPAPAPVVYATPAPAPAPTPMPAQKPAPSSRRPAGNVVYRPPRQPVLYAAPPQQRDSFDCLPLFVRVIFAVAVMALSIFVWMVFALGCAFSGCDDTVFWLLTWVIGIAVTAFTCYLGGCFTALQGGSSQVVMMMPPTQGGAAATAPRYY